jgi:hypothetical protein
MLLIVFIIQIIAVPLTMYLFIKIESTYQIPVQEHHAKPLNQEAVIGLSDLSDKKDDLFKQIIFFILQLFLQLPDVLDQFFRPYVFYCLKSGHQSGHSFHYLL